jgi:hypothetical protein
MEQSEIQLDYFDDHEDMCRMIDGLRLGMASDASARYRGRMAGADSKYSRADSGASYGRFRSSIGGFYPQRLRHDL